MSRSGPFAIFDTVMTRRSRSPLHQWLQPLLASLLLLTFGSNSALPGLLHGCGEQRAAESTEMAGMDHGPHQSHEAPSEPTSPCDCVSHSCCAVALAIASTPLVAITEAVEYRTATPIVATAIVPVAPSFLQPYPVGPPAVA